MLYEWRDNTLLIATGTDTGLVRAENEDSHCALDLQPAWPGFAVAVADGMGGYEAGEVASSLAIDAFAASVRSRLGANGAALDVTDPAAVEAVVQGAVLAAHEAIRAEAASRDVERMGSTLTAALISADLVVWGHIGDSRLYRIGTDTVEQLSSDHSVVGELVRQGGLTESEAMVHPRRNLLTQALGAPGELEIEVGRTRAAPGDIFVLCSDGLTNLVRSDEIAAIVRAGGVEAAPDRLIALANERGGHDNITVVVVGL